MKPVRVSVLNSYIRRVLSSDPVLMSVSVIGEISNFKRHNNGHVYFSLKDEGSRISCFMPGDVFAALTREIGDGVSVTATGRVNVYERGGSYSLNVRELAVEGEGGLAAAFGLMKEKLAAEGLFDVSVKKPLPAFPDTVAIVTSPVGAAIKDMLKVITGKNDGVNVLIYPTLVQGIGAAKLIADGIGYVNERYPDTDVIIVGRGGGSDEDLWAFNEEVVARAIFSSGIPVISAVGHETDITISDLVADARAATPTAAADMAVPDMSDVRGRVASVLSAMESGIGGKLGRAKLSMDACAMPRLRTMAQGMADILRMKADSALAEAYFGVDAAVNSAANTAKLARERLRASDPARLMAIGYAALTKDGRALSSVSGLAAGDVIRARLADGSLELTVDSVRRDGKMV